MSATPDRIEMSLALIHAIAAGIDAAYSSHSCGEGNCGICVLKEKTDSMYRDLLERRAHRAEAEALTTSPPGQTEIPLPRGVQ